MVKSRYLDPDGYSLGLAPSAVGLGFEVQRFSIGPKT